MQRDLSHDEIDSLLSEEIFGHLACINEKKPYIVPLAYVFFGNAIYGQTTEGRKIEILRKNPQVCFQVQKQAEHWWSAMCWGAFEELDFTALEASEASMIVELLTARLGSIQHTVGISVPFDFSGKAEPMAVDDKKSTLFRIVISEKTGREFSIDA